LPIIFHLLAWYYSFPLGCRKRCCRDCNTAAQLNQILVATLPATRFAWLNAASRRVSPLVLWMPFEQSGGTAKASNSPVKARLFALPSIRFGRYRACQFIGLAWSAHHVSP
jgi:hypothetical protein